jgi:hypothetical protein
MFHSELSLIPFVLQMLRMIGDEFYFHRRRTLPRWEWLGHPLDTLSVLLCWSVILLTKPAWVLSGNLVEVSPPVNASAEQPEGTKLLVISSWTGCDLVRVHRKVSPRSKHDGM